MINPKKNHKQNISITLSPRALALLEKLAGQYETSKSGVVDTMLKTYGPKIIKGYQLKPSTIED